MSRPAPARRPSPGRNPRLAKIHIARKELKMDDGAYRAMLQRLTGQTSSADCDDRQLDRVLEELKAKGWKPTVVAGSATAQPVANNRKPRPASHPAAGKARALWISLHQLGVVRNPGEAALEAFAKRQLGVERLQWADQGLVYKLIEALKGIAEREGWSQDLAGVPGPRQIRVLKERLAEAQASVVMSGPAGGAVRLPNLGVRGCSDADLDQHIRQLAGRIQARKAASE